MTRKIATLPLTEIFHEQHHANPNATLETAQEHLQSLAEAAPGEQAPQAEQLLTEVNELIEAHGPRCQLADFLPPIGDEPRAGPGTHG